MKVKNKDTEEISNVYGLELNENGKYYFLIWNEIKSGWTFWLVENCIPLKKS